MNHEEKPGIGGLPNSSGLILFMASMKQPRRGIGATTTVPQIACISNDTWIRNTPPAKTICFEWSWNLGPPHSTSFISFRTARIIRLFLFTFIPSHVQLEIPFFYTQRPPSFKFSYSPEIVLFDHGQAAWCQRGAWEEVLIVANLAETRMEAQSFKSRGCHHFANAVHLAGCVLFGWYLL